MPTLLRRPVALLAALLFAIIFIAGCAHSTGATSQINRNNSVWAGRLSLQVHSEPPQAFVAGFELKGSPVQGELTLNSPLGNSLAVLRWSPQEAVLDSGNQIQRFASVDELIENVTGAAIPLPALFDWLGGKNTSVGGWSADLSQQSTGRISASRATPQPRTDLRIVLAQ